MKSCNFSKRYWFGLILTIVVVLVEATAAVQAANKTLYWQRYDVNLTVQPNSDILVEEIQEISFTSGTFTFGFASIPLQRVKNIIDLQVSELINGSERYYTPNSRGQYGFTSTVNQGNLEITWYFPPTQDSRHTYLLRYRVIGGLRIYDGGDQLWWKAVPPNHNFPINSARIIVTLPQLFSKDELIVASYGASATPHYLDQGQVVFTAENIQADQGLEVRVQFPHGVVQGHPPAWQADDDWRRQWEPVISLISGVVGLLVLIGGGLGLYLLWYKYGRDLVVEPIPKYLTEPPSDLPAGVVGTLIDEKVDVKNIIASIADLGRRGILRIEEKRKKGRGVIGSESEFIFHLVNDNQPTSLFEKGLIRAIFNEQREQHMSDLLERFHLYIVTSLQPRLYAEVVRAGFFPEDPSATRTKWLSIGGMSLMISIMVILCSLSLWLADYSSLLVIFPGLALLVVSLGLMVLSRYMPKKTPAGTKEAAKWLAFKRYLETIKTHGILAAVKDKFEQYLPYAIAFGMERHLIDSFAKVDAPAPSWWEVSWDTESSDSAGRSHDSMQGTDHARERLPSSTAEVDRSPAGPPSPLAGEGDGLPSLSDMSQKIGESLANVSDSLGNMLNSVGAFLTARSDSNGTGRTTGSGSRDSWSGGGNRDSWNGGGGGDSWSSGGSSSGSWSGGGSGGSSSNSGGGGGGDRGFG